MEIKLETQRLLLRELTAADEVELRVFLRDADVMYAWETPFNAGEVRAWLAANLRRYQTEGFSFWAVLNKDSGEFLGVCGPLVEIIDGVKHMGVAYIFNKAHWGRGYAVEAAQACVNYAFNTLGAAEIIAEIRPENKKSRSVAEKLGMQISGSFVKTYKGKAMPHLIYKTVKPQAAIIKNYGDDEDAETKD